MKHSIVFMLIFLLTACAGGAQKEYKRHHSRDYPQGCELIETGMASWYGNEMAKRWENGKPIFNPTANGETFIPEAVSAAHPSLPFGTVVKVVLDREDANPEGVDVRINDRGPFVKGRVIDLSRGAARKLGMADTQAVRIYSCDA